MEIKVVLVVFSPFETLELVSGAFGVVNDW
jgi:hypothetical protein